MEEDKNVKQVNKNVKSEVENKGSNIHYRNKLTKWTHDVLIAEMDKWAYARGMFFFSLMAFFLGHNLNIFLWLFITITTYVLLYRVVRWWVDYCLMYCFEFCYFGISTLVIFILFFPNNKELWLTTYIYASGVMGNSVIIFQNEAQFTNTDLITSAWLHTFPIITSWAIRWRHLLYPDYILNKLSFDFLDMQDLSLIIDPNDKLRILFINPIIFWAIWAMCYKILYSILKIFHST